MTLDHLVKERYPTFVDALRDLDDALSMLFLFSNLPATAQVPGKTIARCQRLCLEFQHYLILSRSLRKSFLSIKGIYYQATIQAQDILWLVPFKFVQKSAADVDFRIMGTFLEFYLTLLSFVNYRLYTTAGIVYPPNFNAVSDENGGELGAFTLCLKPAEAVGMDTLNVSTASNDTRAEIPASASEAVQAAADKVATMHVEDESEKQDPGGIHDITNDLLDTFKPVAKEADDLFQPTSTGTQTDNLFSHFVFYLSRETPKASLEFILKAFGCTRVGWDHILGHGAFTTDEQDPRITHQVFDRPLAAAVDITEPVCDDEVRPSAPTRVPGRIYIQPQWVWDCINQGRLLRPDLYAPGATLPPHLSPWVKPKPGAYDPTKALEEQEEEDEADIFHEKIAEEESRAVSLSTSRVQDVDDDDEDSDSFDDDSSDDSDEHNKADDQPANDAQSSQGMQTDLDSDDSPGLLGNNPDASLGVDALGEFADELDAPSDDQEDETARYQRELDAEAAGLPISVTNKKTDEARKRQYQREKKQQEELHRQRMMMSNKKRKLFDSIQRKNKADDREAHKLRDKRRRLENKGMQTR